MLSATRLLRNSLVVLVATTFSLTGCGGSTNSERTHNAPVANTLGEQITPSPQGPNGIATSAGILVKAKDTGSARAMGSLFKAVNAVEHERFHLVDGLTLIDVAAENLQNTLVALNANPAVAYAEPNYIYTSSVVPNDPDLGRQYHLTQTSDADIDATEAWDLQTGNSVIVAVIDSGVDYNHPDLQNNIWSNTAETPNNGIDDDNNGLVDDIRGWDFANNDNNPMDDNRHGTHVAGIIAAQGNNGIGGSGVAWAAKIMPLKFLALDGRGSTSSAIRAIQYASQMGAKIANNSWGGAANSLALRDAIIAANQAGMLFIAAAGNNTTGVNNDTTPTYPANYPIANVLSVAATTNSDGLASFSNFGPRTVHVAAPGAGIYSTVPNRGYALLSGTSMAAPVVAGMAAILLAANPNLTVAQVKDAILTGADPIAGLSTRVVTGGRVNLFRSVQAIGGGGGATPQPVNVTPATGSSNVAGTVQFQVTGGTPPFTWSVTNTAVGTINTASGLFTAVLAGSTNVVARDSVGVQGVAVVTVTAAPIALALSPLSTSQMTTRQTLQLTASGGTPPYRWSSSNTAVATVNSQGLVNTVTAGNATISVTDSLNAVQSTIISVIAPAAVLPISPSAPVIAVGRSVALTITGATAPVVWSSAQPSIATVDAATGVVTGVAPGTATINMSDAAANTGSTTVTVRQIQVQTPGSTVTVGSTITGTASGGTAPYTWSTSEPTIAGVNATTGVITGIGAGTATITATDANNIASSGTTINVTAATSTPVPTQPGGGGTPSACTTLPTASPITVTPRSVTMPATWWVRFTASGGTPPYVWSVCSTAAGDVSETTGWFHAGSQMGSTSTVVVRDANGQQQVATVTLGDTVSVTP